MEFIGAVPAKAGTQSNRTSLALVPCFRRESEEAENEQGGSI